MKCWRAGIALFAAIASGTLAGAQSGISSFEVATIKPTDPQGRQMAGIDITASGRVKIVGTTLAGLIVAAYNVGYWQINGITDWMKNDRLDLEAKAPELANKGTYDTRHTIWSGIEDIRLRRMLQLLLKERFKLEIVMETHDGTVMELVQSGKALRLNKDLTVNAVTGLSGEVERTSGRGWMLFRTSMPKLAQFLSDFILRKQVIDHTGLEGYYNFESAMTQTDEDFRGGDVADTFLPVLGEMGLKLKSSHGSVTTYIIRHAERASEN